MKQIFLILSILLSFEINLRAGQQDPMEFLFNNIGLEPGEEFYKMGYKEYEKGNYDKAFEYFYKAHQNGNLTATYMVGDCLFAGRGTQTDISKAMEFIKYAADKGQLDACMVMGMIQYDGLEFGNYKVAQNKESGLKLMKYAADKGHSDAQWTLADYYYQEEKYDTAFKYYELSANQNNPKGLYRTGVRLMDGDGTPVDLKRAESLIMKAKEMGEDVDFVLGKLYYKQGNYNKAIAMFKPLSQSDASAIRWLGSCYISLPEPDYALALQCYEKAAQSQELLGMFYSAIFYYEGLGCEKNIAKAVPLFHKILDSTGGSFSLDDEYVYIYGTTCKLLGNCYRFGRGVPKDEEYADTLTKYAEQTGLGDLTLEEIINNITRSR